MHGSKDELRVDVQMDGVTIRQAQWGDMNAAIEDFAAGVDTRPVFKGLPDDRCQCPHWGYVVRGQARVLYADREEVLGTGQAYFLPPGHNVVYDEDTQVVEFSPAGEYARTLEVAGRNVAAMAAADARP
ncbi:MAG TPA: AraC family ligand binding domain-containing protein [Chloroflexota bacterium]|jgi:hypothetical protein